MSNFNVLSQVEANYKTATAKQGAEVFLSEFIYKDVAIAELSSVIPEAFNGLNAEAVRFICNIIKELTK